MECWPSSAIATVWWAVAIPHLEVAEIFPRDCARVAEQRKIARREDRKVLAMRKTWRRRRDSNLSRFEGVSEAKDLAKDHGAGGGTRTPTPLRVHGPEPCASANSATSARVDASQKLNSRSGSMIIVKAQLAISNSPFAVTFSSVPPIL